MKLCYYLLILLKDMTYKIIINEKKLVNKALQSNWISSNGPYVKKFESNFSKYNNKKFGIAVSNGTAALEIALKCFHRLPSTFCIIFYYPRKGFNA